MTHMFALGLAAIIIFAVLVTTAVVMAVQRTMWFGAPMHQYHDLDEMHEEWEEDMRGNATWHHEDMEDWGCPMH